MEREATGFPAEYDPANFAPVLPNPRDRAHGPSQAALVLGILALTCNALLVFAAFGILFGIIAVIMGAVNYRQHRYAKAGLILGLLSFVPLAAYLFSIIAVVWADPMLF